VHTQESGSNNFKVGSKPKYNLVLLVGSASASKKNQPQQK
jgi:hypothetical protein